jgi:hypothetical protein
MLLCGPGDHLCDPLPALLQGVVYHPPALSPCCLSCLFFTENLVLSLTPCPPLFSSAGSECHPPPLLSVLYYSSLHIFQFCWRGIRLPWGWASLCSWVWIGESRKVCISHLFALPIDMQAGLEPVAVVAVRNGTKCFQCRVA